MLRCDRRDWAATNWEPNHLFLDPPSRPFLPPPPVAAQPHTGGTERSPAWPWPAPHPRATLPSPWGSPNPLPPDPLSLGWQLSVCCFSSLPWWSPTAPRRNWPREGPAVPAAFVQLLSPPCTQEGSEATCVSKGIYRDRWRRGLSKGTMSGTHTMSPAEDMSREGCFRGWEQLPELRTRPPLCHIWCVTIVTWVVVCASVSPQGIVVPLQRGVVGAVYRGWGYSQGW